MPLFGQRYTSVKQYKALMRQGLGQALAVWGKMPPEERRIAADKISELNAIKYRIEARARELGYSQACRDSIPVCQGECCRRHFPEDLGPVDFLISIALLSRDEQKALVDKLGQAEPEKYQCPFLEPDGCFFSFASRPFVCAVAYPCHMGREYWEFKEKHKTGLKPIYDYLTRIFHRYSITG